MRFETTIEIQAPGDLVWATLADVERWPTWTASMRRVEILTKGPLGLSAKVRVKHPRLSALVWDVTEFVPGEVFTWRSSILGVTCVGTHRVSARAPLTARRSRLPWNKQECWRRSCGSSCRASAGAM